MTLNRIGLISVAAALLVGGLFAWFYADNGGFFQTAMAPADKDLAFYRSGPFRVGVGVNPTVPAVGENRLTVKVQNSEGEPVSDANVRAEARMTMTGMAPMQAGAALEETAPGVYQGPFELEMSGAWPLSVSIEKQGIGSTRLSFDMATGRRGLDLASGGAEMEPAGEARASQVEANASNTDGNGSTYRVGPFKLNVALEPNPPQVGKNQLIISLHDQQGNPVSGARIDAVAEMPAMGAMPAMQAPVNFKETKPGRYVGAFELAMSGEWPLSIEIQKEGMGSERISYEMATGRAGLQFAGAAGTITVDARRRQLIGVELGEVRRRDLTRSIRAVGSIDYNETLISEVSLRFDAWIGELMADYVGVQVEKGEVLFTVYGPELLAAQQEYLETRKRLDSMGADDGLIAAARKRLLLWDMTPVQIEALERRGEPLDYVPIMAPRDGTVVAKQVVEGTAMAAGTTLMRIVDLSSVWVEAEVYETDLPLIEAGMPATITLPYLPGHVYEARVDYVYPTLDADTRTGRVRLILDSPDGVLKPDMYAEVELQADLGRVLAVPEEAVLFAGDSRVVFVDLGDGRLKPQKITTGRRADGYIEVLEGLKPGATVVTSGNFLIAAETRLKTGMEQW